MLIYASSLISTNHNNYNDLDITIKKKIYHAKMVGLFDYFIFIDVRRGSM